ncbi:MAG: hypothetical protein KJ051_02335 [Thermoleophilia bacterium]|nr:hypothetical protein [Thermoleophilia bacterium]
MTTRRTLGIVAAFVLTAIVAGIPVLTAGASSERSFTLLVRYDKSSFETDDVAPKGTSVGDQFFFTGALTRDGKPAGRLEDMDVVIDPRIEGFARWATLLLPEGTIVAAGGGGNRGASGWHPPAEDSLAILGGTRAYAGATGEITVRDRPDGTQRLTISLH